MHAPLQPNAGGDADAGTVSGAVERLAADVQALGDGLAGMDPLAAVEQAVRIRQGADAVLPAVVGIARTSGNTWQEIGDVLGISRQAAFQRFGRPTDPRTGELMETTPFPGAAERGADVFGRMAAGDWHAVHANFDDTMAGKLPEEDQLGGIWAQVVATVGEFDSAGEPTATRAADYTVVDVPLGFEAADMVGRVSFDRAGRTAGLFILTPAQAENL